MVLFRSRWFFLVALLAMATGSDKPSWYRVDIVVCGPNVVAKLKIEIEWPIEVILVKKELIVLLCSCGCVELLSSCCCNPACSCRLLWGQTRLLLTFTWSPRNDINLIQFDNKWTLCWLLFPHYYCRLCCFVWGMGENLLRDKNHDTYNHHQYVKRSNRNALLAAVSTLVNRSARFFSVPCLATRIVPDATASRHRW